MRYSLTLLILIFFCALNIQAQQYNLENFAAQLDIEESPQRLSRQIDSASQVAFIPFHAKIYDTLLHPGNAQRMNGDLYWRLKSPGFDLKVYLNTKLRKMDTLYAYNGSGELREVIHRGNHFTEKWISSVYTDEILLRYYSHSGEEPEVRITNYSLQLKKPSKKTATGFGDSEFCEVNVNCPEGTDFSKVAGSVVRINTKLGGFEGWCTGTLINNTAYDYTPYIITAEHCGYVANNFVPDLENWEFFFKYEAKDCSTPASEAAIPIRKITGSALIARSDDGGGDFGSDFVLLQLTDSIGFNQLPSPFFAGWNRANNAPGPGVSIHHPQGDIKKISTFNSSSSSEFSADALDSHWEVHWIATANGHGVTEIGSSGCPLFDENGLLTGVLTGGRASCFDPHDPDYFGKFSYSWDQNGQQANRKLQPWLDPQNTGFVVIQGSYFGDAIPIDTNEFAVVPIPVNTGTLEITGIGTSQNLTGFQIFSLDGRLVYKKEKATVPNTPEKIDVSNFSSGVYILRIVQDKATRTTKIMVIN